MSCCVSKLDLCRLIQESYKSPTFNFGDTDVTNDTFVYKVKIAGESFTEYPCTVIAPNIVVIDEYTLPVGNYIHEMLWTSSNGTELIFQGALKITSVGSCCGSSRNNTIKVIQNETVVRINVTESNITIENGEWGSIDGDINEQTDLIELVDSAVNDMATQTWVENQNYLTEETDPTVPSHVKSITTTDISNWNNKQNQLTAGTNISIVGNTISSTVNLNGYATETWVNSQGFSKFSGSYNDLTNKPALFSGNYNDLTNKPTIPTVGNGTITITQGGVSKGSFTTNQSGNTTIEVDSGGGGGTDLMISITHADLLDLVINSELVAGQQYRITDYVATVTSEFTEYAESANHPFDIIVIADSTNKLNENARAIRHEGDTYYPSTTIFEKWKIKYSIYNDNNRFEWANAINGKGVIYELQDEYNNIMPFDFKGIKLYNSANSSYQYAFGGSADVSLSDGCIENKQVSTGNYFTSLPFIFLGSGCYMNTFSANSQNIHIGNNFRGCNVSGSQHTIGNDCSNLYINSNGITIGDGNNFHEINSIVTIGDYAPCIFKVHIGAYVEYDIIDKLSNFTTPPNGNVVEVMSSASGNTVMQQRVSASVTEAFDVV